MASSILLTLYAVFIFLAYGTTAAVSRLLGAGDEREAAHQAVQSLWLAVLVGLALVVLGLAGAGTLVDLMGAEGAVRSNALLYLRISLPGVPRCCWCWPGTGYLRGLQDTRTPLAGGRRHRRPQPGARGGVHLRAGHGPRGLGGHDRGGPVGGGGRLPAHRRRAARSPTGGGWRPHPASLRRLGGGRDLLVRTAALRASLLVATAVAARLGPVDLAAHQVAFEVWSFLALGLDAIAIAGQALVGRALGAGDGAMARGAGRRMIELGVAAGIVVGVAVAVARRCSPTCSPTIPRWPTWPPSCSCGWRCCSR